MFLWYLYEIFIQHLQIFSFFLPTLVHLFCFSVTNLVFKRVFNVAFWCLYDIFIQLYRYFYFFSNISVIVLFFHWKSRYRTCFQCFFLISLLLFTQLWRCFRFFAPTLGELLHFFPFAKRFLNVFSMFLLMLLQIFHTTMEIFSIFFPTLGDWKNF